ncbi:unnamed protein product [Aspergillus oryzae RIB40]|uniref:DNA, SC012 n=2 Tax=Aspergillus oryzae TaxID=5062 RepID=Q2UBZ7_ASPOR|nr:unnamed protein product [Aspergillus oryzae RIB40]EIT79344.1 hypothetical protein Ao3042_04180 [Aspergillus oryzae 3.042]BAE60918.1 unnamed protein product [Aspergillus oryzae RIB40]|eukprot:EIT79344.1 hypothetical protein Ao3042_04180 [Aspergillus oryzae 3.042]
MDNISDIGSPLSERSRTPFFDGGGISLSGLPFEEALVARIGEPLVLGVEPSISEPAVVEPTAAECRESAVLALAAFTADDFIACWRDSQIRWFLPDRRQLRGNCYFGCLC